MNGNQVQTSLPPLLQNFFCERLIAQRNVTHQTVATYRDAFRLLLGFAADSTGKSPSDLALEELDAPLILAFLDHLEVERGNSIRTRNTRLTAIRSFMRFASYQAPSSLPTIQQVLAIPTKRFDKPMLDSLSRTEVEAILTAPDRSTWSGHRDFVMFSTFYNTGARVSEITRLRIQDLSMQQGRCVHIFGKGRKQRSVPLWKGTVTRLKEWLPRIDISPNAPLFPNRSGKPISRSGVEHRLREAVQRASQTCPSLLERRISPHTMRHTVAMHLLQSGVDITVIALWLGHESPATTHIYIEADMAMKERALAKLQEPASHRFRYRPNDQLLAFLETL